MTQQHTHPGGSAELAAASWAPAACTLPTAEQPLRIAEFDAMFAASLRDVARLSVTRLRLRLDPDAEATVRDLTTRESECCSFFAFTVRPLAGELHLDVEVPPAQVALLDALATRAAAAARQAA